MRASWVGLSLFLILPASGCGGPDKPVKVKGKLTLDDQPVAGALVTFLKQGPKGHDAHGQTQADGSFELTTFTANDGALPGDYKVVVEYHEPVAHKGTYRDQREAMQAVQKEKSKTPPRYAIPAKYSDPSQTPLRQKVPPDGEAIVKLQSNG